tara:strand:- start:185 stop:394 length:210 start_codon:yes stop_codon:yes gene_type:complete
VKEVDKEITLLDSDISSNKGLKKDSYKTTNINILLNRVRLDKKRSFKKKILILSFIATITTALTVYFII